MKETHRKRSIPTWIIIALITILPAAFIGYTMVNPPSANPPVTPSPLTSTTPTNTQTTEPTQEPTAPPTPGPFINTVTYTIWLSTDTCFAIDSQGYQPTWSGSTNATYVIQSTLDAMAAVGGILHIKSGTYQCHFQIPYTAATLLIQGEGNTNTIFAPDQTLNAVITRQTAGPYPSRIILRDFEVNCTNGKATNGVDLSDAPANESPKNIQLNNIRVQGHSGYGIKMNHNDNSQLTDCTVENPAANAKCLQWNCTTGQIEIIRGYYHPGDMELAAQTITLDNVQLSGIRIIADSQTMHLIDPTTPNLPVLSTNNFIETQNCWLGDLTIENPTITLDNNSNFIAGNYTNTITIANPKIYIAQGKTATIIPSYPTLTSKYYNTGGPFAQVSITGGGRYANPSGIINLTPPNYRPGTNIIIVENFDGKNQGNVMLGEVPPGDNATQKTITLPIPYCDGDYIVYIEQAGNMCWASDKTNTGFTLNYNVPGGFTVSWIAIHT
jgi:hypothetical protein